MFRTILTGALALSVISVIGVGGRANAATEQDNSGVVKVVYGDADLHTPEGARSLAMRVRHAAARACEEEASMVWDPGTMAECREQAVAGAIKDLNAPLLTNALAPSRRHAVASR